MELNKIYQIDCLEGMDLMIEQGMKVDMILADLPYGQTEINWDKQIKITELWKRYEKLITDNGSIILFSQQPFTSLLVSSNMKLFKHSLIWHKDKCGNFLAAKYQPRKTHEDINVFSKAGFTHNSKPKAVYNPIMVKREKPYVDKRESLNKTDTIKELRPNRKDNTNKLVRDLNRDMGFNYPESIVYFPVEQKNKLHPTQKPVPLFEHLITTYTNEGQVVLDNCIGSGTTAIASESLNRNWIGFEIEPKYVEIANKRLNDFRLAEAR